MKYLAIIFCLLISWKAFSHGGGLDKKGCHNNQSTGDYHCHRGSSSQDKTSKYGKMTIGNEKYFNLRFASNLGGRTEVTYNYDYNINGKSPRIASIRVDIVTDQYVIEGGLDKRSSLDSIQQAVFASTISGKKPAVAIYDTNGLWGKFEHRIWSAAKRLNVKFYWVSGNEIREVN